MFAAATALPGLRQAQDYYLLILGAAAFTAATAVAEVSSACTFTLGSAAMCA